MESDNEKMDIENYIIKLSTKVMQEMQDEIIKNIDGSRLDREHTLNILRTIARCEFECDILLTLTEEIGGFGSFYSKKCLETLKLFRTILEKFLQSIKLFRTILEMELTKSIKQK